MQGRSVRSSGASSNSDEEEEYSTEAQSADPWWKRWCLALLTRDQSAGLFELTRFRSSRHSRSSSASNGSNRRLNKLVIHPDSWGYTAWKQFILVWAVYSSFFTPLEFGFFRGLPENLFFLDIAGQIVFLIDIVISFFLAYRDSSYRLVYERRRIGLRYLKSRFVVDLLGCLPWDAIYKACGRNETVRYMLWIRLSRACRITDFFEKMEKDIRINYLFTRIVKLFVVELYCTHTAACIFYYLATTLPASKEGYTWIGSLKMGDYSYSNFREIDLWKRYITSLYFAIVTMATVGYGDIHAVNVREMIFIMIYVSFDMILGAYLLGNMAALIVRGSRTERFRDKTSDIINYINKHKLGSSLSNQIKHHLWLQYESSYAKDAVLQDLPISIRAKVSQKLYEPHIKEMALFKGCSHGFIKEIVIVEQGSIVNQIYFICHGKVDLVGNFYDDEAGESNLYQQNYTSLGDISVLCNMPEPSTVQVREPCRLLRIDKRPFMDILDTFFTDGRILLNNFLEGKEANIRNRLMESEISLLIRKYESDSATRLNSATYDGDLCRLKHLVKAGADPSKPDYDGRTSLHVAASKGHKNIVLFLLQQGAPVNILDNFGQTPLLEAIKKCHDEVASLLLDAGAKLTLNDAGDCLCKAVAAKDSEFLRRVLKAGINPNAKSYDLRTPLHIAASQGLYSIAEMLLEAGASVFSKDRWGNTPLHDASVGGDINLIKLMQTYSSSHERQGTHSP
ncbi:hypothetical protein V2J09_019380 [Rumex salicifolius]